MLKRLKIFLSSGLYIILCRMCMLLAFFINHTGSLVDNSMDINIRYKESSFHNRAIDIWWSFCQECLLLENKLFSSEYRSHITFSSHYSIT